MIELFTEITSTELITDFITSAVISATDPLKLIPTTESESTTQHFSIAEITEVFSVKEMQSRAHFFSSTVIE